MKKLATIIAATILISGIANTAQAEQFIVMLEKPISGNDLALRESLSVVEIDSFQHNQNWIVVFDAKDMDVMQAYFYAKQLKPLTIQSFPTTWSDTGVEAMSVAARLSFLNNVDGEFCTN